MAAPPLIICGGRHEIFQDGYTCKVKVTEVRLSASYITLVLVCTGWKILVGKILANGSGFAQFTKNISPTT